MVMVLARNWWALALRGVLAIVFGVLAFALPLATAVSLALLVGAYLLVDGVFAVVAAVRAAERHERWALIALEGVAGVVAGILSLVLPGLTLIFLLYLIGFWALLTGILAIAAAVRLRRHLRNEWLMALNGVASVALGVLVLVSPGLGLMALLWWLGGYALFTGIMLLGLAIRLRGWHRTQPG